MHAYILKSINENKNDPIFIKIKKKLNGENLNNEL